MKLYYYPHSCSLASHIILREAGLEFELVKADLLTKKTERGDDFNLINTKGYVPALALDNGVMLTEGAAILQYLADLVPEKKLIPERTAFERYTAQAWLNFVSTEIHKSLSGLLKYPKEAKDKILQILHQRLDYVENHLQQHRYLMGSQFGVADAYLFTIIRGLSMLKLIDLQTWPTLARYMAVINQRPAVIAAIAAETNVKVQA